MRCGRAHPRACGENVVHGDDPGLQGGSSPRVRGKHGEGTGTDCHERLIPARAGKTPSTPHSSTRGWAHPRACGENPRRVPERIARQGSSPRVRGKPPPGLAGRTRCGLIPARAGKTHRVPGDQPTPPAHPRACGENGSPREEAVLRTGSSPRVRGKPRTNRDADLPRRLIPARAGKTGTIGRGGPRGRAHPRVCGENLHETIIPLAGMGSSPRVRGKRRPSPLPGAPRGLIPACAGKTSVIR